MTSTRSGPLGWAALVLAIGGCATDEGHSSKKDAGTGGPTYQPSPGGVAAGGAAAPASGSPAPAGTSGLGGSGGSSATGAGGAAALMPPPNSGDRYTSPGTNPFVVARHDPFSTFAVDVDTASYDIFRRDVNLGGLPQPASVRLEEYVNAFKYDYPAPTAQERAPFRVSVAAAGQVFDRQSVLLRGGVQGRMPPPFEKRPANLVFLVDVSGSMSSPDKLPLVQKTLAMTLDVLAPTDKVSIVTYAGDTRVRLEPTPVSDRSRILTVIGGLTAAGSTAGASGIDLAYEQAARGFVQDGINHVLLCTDGDFNVGVSTTTGLVALIEEKRRSGITLTVLGYGVGNLNDDLMESVSNAGNGIYGVISSEEHARKYVAERMLSTIVHIARDVKLQVEFNPDRVHAYRLLGYENRAIADRDFRNDVVDAGEIGAGHRVTALYELVLTGGRTPDRPGAPALLDGTMSSLPREARPQDLVLVKVRWKRPDATEQTAAEELAQSLAHDEIAETVAAADADLQWAAAIASFAEILKGSPYASPSDLPRIAAIVEAQAQRDADRAEFAALFAKARARLPR